MLLMKESVLSLKEKTSQQNTFKLPASTEHHLRRTR